MIGLRENFRESKLGHWPAPRNERREWCRFKNVFRALSAGDFVKAALDLEYLSARVVREVVRLLNPRLVHLPLGGKG